MRFMMQDSIMAAGAVCTAGSKMLYNFKAPLSATVYEKCLKKGMEFVGFTLPCEFGADSLFDSLDGLDPAVTALSEGRCDAVLCNDVFGKLRRQAPLNGLIYMQPAYGTVSRYGLIPAVSSMDQIGVLCREFKDGLAVLSAISGYDSFDGTSLPAITYDYNTGREREWTVGLPGSIFGEIRLADNAIASEIELKYFELLAPVFYILACAEISNNTTRYDGVKFGYRAEDAGNLEELYIKSRSEGFGRDIQLASVMGCMVLSHEHYDGLYYKSMQVRRLVKEYYAGLLEKVDAIALPVKLDGRGKYEQAGLYALPLLGGFACVSVPYKNNCLQFVCARGKENAMFSLAWEGMQ